MSKSFFRQLLTQFLKAPVKHRRRRIHRPYAAMVESLELRQMLSASYAGIITETLPAGSTGNEITSTLTSSETPSGQNLGSPITITSHQGAGLIINPTFDSTITGDPNAATIEATINGVIAEYEAAFSDPITVNITFQEMTTGLGQSNTFIYDMPYTELRSDLVSNATTINDTTAVNHLPNQTNEPVLNQPNVVVTSANVKALENNAISESNPDGTISLNTSICNLDRTTIDPSKYDLAAVAAHEMDEVMGLGSGVGGTTIRTQDLFRYDQNGVRNFTTATNALAYFSIDGSNKIVQFNQSGGGADYGDWATSGAEHVQNAFGTPGITLDPNIEFEALDVQGYHYVSGAASLPKLTVNDVTVNQGTSAVFTISLAQKASVSVTVSYATSDGTATTAAGDYTATSGTATIPAGSNSTTVTVPTFADGAKATSTFFLNLSGATSAGIANAKGAATVIEPSIPALSLSNFTSIGPGPIGGDGTTGGTVSGRITAIAADPTNANIIYVAAAGGGVWKTTDGGASWIPLTDNQATLAMGAIALCASNPKVIYAGTGEANNSGDSQAGLGVLVSQDGGATWTLTGTTPFLHAAISKVAVDPDNPAVAYVATSGGSAPGIYETSNYGSTWTLAFTKNDSNAQYSDIVIDPSSPVGNRTLFAAVGAFYGNANNGVYESTDNGVTWNPAGNFPAGTADGRISIALAPTNDKVLYASISSPSTSGLLEMEKSTDGGVTWNTLSSTPNYMGTQGWYDQTLAVSPTDSNVVFAGGSYAYGGTSPDGLIESTDGGSTWTEIGLRGLNGIGPHADHHGIAFDANGKLLDGDDGGIYRLEVATPTAYAWTSLNSNLNITQFTGIALDPTNPNIAYGGSQDNGTEKFTGSPLWQLSQGGDGGFVRVDPNNPQTVYHTFYYSGDGFLERSNDGGVTWTGKTTGIITTDPNLPDPESDPARFYPPYVIDPSNSNRLVLGTNRVYETLNNGDSWTPISAPATGNWTTSSPIESIGTVGNTVYAAAGGHIYVTTNDGGNWTETTPASSTGFSYEDIWVNPSNPAVAYAITGQSSGIPGQGHVFMTSNFGATWTDLSGNLPDLPGHAIRVDTRNNAIYVGLDNGVYDSLNNGTTWQAAATGLPNVQVVGLDLDPVTDILGVATHGRGMWELSLGTPAKTITVDTLSDIDQAGTTTLRDAIAQADTDPAGDVIKFANGLTGTITLTNGVLDITNSMTITGPGANVLSISGNNASGIFDVDDGNGTADKSVSITGLSLIQGNSSNSGGAIYNAENLSVSGDTFSGNAAGSFGGAIENTGGSVISSGDTFSSNTSVFDGGAIDLSGGTLTSTNDTFFGNSTGGSGGAIDVFPGTLTTTNDTITGNSAFGSGGGIYLTNGGNWNSSNTIVAGNQTSSTPVKPSEVTNDSTGTITANNTLIGDAASSAGITNGTNGNIVGVATTAIFVTNGSGVPVLANNGGTTQTVGLVAGSPAIGAGGAPAQTLDERGFTRITNDLGAFANLPPTNLALSNSNVLEQQPIGTAVGTFNTTETDLHSSFAYTLVSGTGSTDNGSFTIDANGVLRTNQILSYATQPTYSIRVQTTDQFNNTIQNVFIITLGRVLVVNTLSDTDQAGTTTLRDAIATANSDASGDSITFLPGLTGTITLTQGVLSIKSSMSIVGPGANILAISGNNSSSIFTVDDGDKVADKSVSITGLTMTQGNAAQGGAIANSENLTLSGDTFTANTATSYGGALENNAGSIVSSNDTFSFNTAVSDGGAYDNFNGSMISTNDTFFGNSVTSGNGGALDDFSPGTLTTVNDTITGNWASAGGGGVFIAGNWNSLNTIVAGNQTAATSGSPSDVVLNSGTISASDTLIGDAGSSGGITNGTNGNIVGVATSSIFVTNGSGVPMLANNGGTTQTVALVAGSPAAGTGAPLSTLATSLDAAPTSTTLTVSNSLFLAVGDSVRIDSEILQVTAVSGTVVTVLRAQGGTSLATHALNAPIVLNTDEIGATRGRNDLGALTSLKVVAPTAARLNQYGSFTFATNAINLADVLATATSDTLTLTVADGTLMLGSITGLTFTGGANGSSSMMVTGTLANLSAAVSGLKYTPTPGFSGTDSLNIALNDSGSIVSAIVPLTVVIAPTIPALAPQSTLLNTAVVFSAGNSNPLSIIDSAVNSSTVQLALSAVGGTLTLSTTTGLTVTSGANTTAAMTVQGTLAAINAALSGLKFTPASNYAGAASLTLNYSDLGVAGTGPRTVSCTVAIVVNYPVYTIVDQATGYAETAGTWTTSGVTGYNGVATRSSSSTNGAATFTPVLAAGAYQVSFYNPATAGATTDAKITVTHNGTSNVYTVNEATGTAGYITLGILNFTGSGNESVTISQGTTSGTMYASAVQFARTGNIPVITAPATQSTPLNNNLIFSTANSNAISIADTSLNSNVVQLALSAVNGKLTLSTANALTVTSGGNGTAAMTLQGTLAALNIALNGLKFSVPLNYAGGASLSMTFSDLGVGGAGPVQTVSKTVPITISYPVYTVVDQATGYAETAGTWATSGVTGYNGVATRSSSTATASATWTPTLLAGVYQVSFYNPATAGATTDAKVTVFHNGTSNVYTVNEATGTAGYITLGFLSFAGSGNEYVSISQGGGTGTLYASAVQFAQAGSIPTVTVPATQTTSINTNVVFSTANSNAISIADSSVNNNTVQLALSAVSGQLTLSTTAGLTVTSGANGTAAMTVQGTLAAINAALSGLKFTVPLNYAGGASVTLTFNDLGGGGGGPVQTVTKTVAITVQYPVYTVVDQAAGYAETAGTWSTSAVTGYNGVATRTSSSSNAVATWTPVLTAGVYQVSFYNPATAGATTHANITVFHNGTSNVYGVNESTGTPGYITLGILSFSGSGNEYVSITQGGTAALMYASAVQFARAGSIPAMTVPTTTQNATLNTGFVFSAANSNAISITDSSVNSNTVQLALSSVNGVLTLSTTSGLVFTAGGNATAALTIQGTLAAINAALSGLKFTPSNNYAGAASMALTFSDLGGGGGGPVQTLSKSIAITVKYPVYTLVDQAAGYAETAGTWATSAVNGYNGVAMRSSSSSNAVATWTPVLTAGTYQIMFYDPATAGATTNTNITIVHNGNTTVIGFNETSGTAGFVSLGYFNFNGSGTESISISRGGGTGTLYASAVQFVQSGTIPTLTAPAATQNTPVNTALVFSTANSNAISIADSSVSTNTVQLTLSVTNGVLNLATVSGLTFTSGTNASASMTVKGTLAALNAALAGLKYTPTNNYSGAASLSLNYSDLGVGGAGPVQTASKTVNITV